MGELKDILLNFGAIAGFAGIIGLAVLAMLYFSQARDVRRLREWAGREPERAGEIELRAQQIASQAIAQAYESMALRQSEASAAASLAQDAGHEISSAPLVAADAGQPEVAEAPLVAHDPQETQAHDVVANEFGEETDVDEAAAVVQHEDAEAGGEAPAEVESEEHEGEEAEHVPYEVAAASAGAGDTVVQSPPPEDNAAEPAAPAESEQNLLQPSTPAAARAAAPLPPLPPLDTSEFTAVRTPTTPPIPDYYLSTGATGSGHFEAIEPPAEHRSRVPFAVAGVLVAVFAVILIGTQLIGGDDTTSGDKKTPTSAQETQNTADRDPRINRAAVTVAVLNGTDTAGIAATAATGLNKAGFTDTTTGNLNDGTVHPTTIVYYAPGSKQEAQEVATELAVKDVKPATDEVLAAGGSVPVIVVLGANFGQ
ncbi:MAG: LytR C-terminal domain-containing protein [Thermoleophilaceae bacterium]|nr:LytR C-terminal domain-containing protein [Thermoleophilaceae bacterium]